MNVLKQMIFIVIVFASATSWAMDVDKKIKELKGEHSDLLRKIEKRAGGNSTIAYRALLKSNESELNKISERIQELKLLKANL